MYCCGGVERRTVRPYLRFGTLWFEIDGDMLAARQEMLELADGVYSVGRIA